MALQPYLEIPALRRVVQCLANPSKQSRGHASSSSGPPSAHVQPQSDTQGLLQWVRNARVMSLLEEACMALKSGRLSEQELEEMMLRQLQVTK